jgi:hypothetical protein
MSGVLSRLERALLQGLPERMWLGGPAMGEAAREEARRLQGEAGGAAEEVAAVAAPAMHCPLVKEAFCALLELCLDRFPARGAGGPLHLKAQGGPLPEREGREGRRGRFRRYGYPNPNRFRRNGRLSSPPLPQVR